MIDNFKLVSEKGEDVTPVCLPDEKFKLWVIPFHFEDPFVLAESSNLTNLIGAISKREEEIVKDAFLTKEERAEANYVWNDQWIIPADPIVTKQIYSDVNQAVNPEVVNLIKDSVIIAAFIIDSDESDTYVIVKENAIQICVTQIDHCRGYEGTSVGIHSFKGILEEFIARYNDGEYAECFNNGRLILAPHNDFGFHKSEYGNGYMYDDGDVDTHFIVV